MRFLVSLLLPLVSVSAINIRSFREQFSLQAQAHAHEQTSTSIHAYTSLTSLNQAITNIHHELELLQQQRIDLFTVEQNDAILDVMDPANGQVGLEIEMQTSPRIVMYSHKKGKPSVKTMPQFYSDEWAVSKNGVWKISTDNEARHLKDLGDPLKGYYVDSWKTYVDEASLLSSTCGLNTAMELLTLPIDTDHYNNHFLLQVALREFVNVMKTYSTAAGPFEDCTKIDKMGLPGVKAATHNCVLYEEVRAEYATKMDALEAKGGLLAGIGVYQLLPEVIPNHADTYIAAGQEYRVYMMFPRNVDFSYAAQVNFGYPIANWASAAIDKRLDKQVAKTGTKYVKDSPTYKWKFTHYIIQDLAAWGRGIAKSRVIDPYDAANGGAKLSANEKADIEGFFTAALYYWFNTGYMGGSSKGIHNVLIKAPINDIIRAFNDKQRTALSLYTKDDGIDQIQADFVVAGADVYVCAGLAAKGYLPARTKAKRLATQKSIVENIFKFQTGKNRYAGETNSKYGVLTPAYDDVIAVTATGKPVAPYNVRNRVAVLLESRPGSWEFNRAWTDIGTYVAPSELVKNANALKTQVNDVLSQMVKLQTTLLQLQQHRDTMMMEQEVSMGKEVEVEADVQAFRYKAKASSEADKKLLQEFAKTRTLRSPLITTEVRKNNDMLEQESFNDIDPIEKETELTNEQYLVQAKKEKEVLPPAPKTPQQIIAELAKKIKLEAALALIK